MSNRGPSLMALLGLLAVAGYQNKDKLSDMLNRSRGDGTSPGLAPGFGDQIKGMLGTSPVGGVVSSAIDELMAMFKGTPQEDHARSWVATGDNAPVAPGDLADVIGEDALSDLSQKTGLSRDSLLSALAQRLPTAVDAMTPQGRSPTASEARDYI